MRKLRTVIFWIHLSVALLVGVVVAIMAFTGTTLAFEKEIIAWAEAGPPSTGAGKRLDADQLLASVALARPDGVASAVVLHADPGARARVNTGREGGVLVDPHGGTVTALPGQGWRTFLQKMVAWHRTLGATGENRDLGRAFTGVANAAFLFLALSGLYLWWPRRWTGRSVRLSLWFRRGLGAKTRDWNWHNVIGFWSLPVLIVITLSGMMISYRWVSNLVYRAAGEAPPTGQGPAGLPPVVVPAPAPGAQRVSVETLVASARAAVPGWKTMTVRLREPARPGGGNAAAGQRREGGEKIAPIAITVKEARPWPRFSSITLSMDPFTGQVLRKETFADYGPGRRTRSWLRFLHTGEALGWPGQIVAGVVSLGALVLAWTGFALAWRRLVRRRPAFPEGQRADAIKDSMAG